MLVLLVDWKKNSLNYLEKEFSALNIPFKTFDIPDYSMLDLTVSYRIFNLYFKYLKLARRAVMNSDPDDVLICLNYTTSIAVGYVCKVLNKRRKIVGLNMIAHKRFWPIEWFRRLVFSPIMSMPSFIITVNSEHYIGEYSKRFRVQDNKFFVLTDPGQPRSQLQTLITENSFVFTGGEAKRDWETLFKSCRMLPVIKFVCIARKKYFNMFLEIPQNVELLFDTDSETFYDYMRNSSIVVIPLKSLSPAGLIVLLDAAIMNKPVIITKTPSTENYIIDGQSGFLTNPENEEELTTKIQQLWDSTELQNRFAINLKNSVMANHTPQIYSTSLLSILKDNNMFPINK